MDIDVAILGVHRVPSFRKFTSTFSQPLSWHSFNQSARQIPRAVHQPFGEKFGGVVPVKNQDFLKRRFDLERANAGQRRMAESSSAAQIRPRQQ